MQTTTLRSTEGMTHLFCPVEEGSNPGEDRDPLNIPKTPLCERERERESGSQREEGQRERERERGGGEERERPAERELETNRHCGRVVRAS